jgi:phage-related minor tail protein
VPEFGGVFATLLERTNQEAGTLNDAVGVLGRGFVDAFEGAIQRGESLSDVLKGLALDLAEIALKTAGNALLESILGGILGGIGGGFGGGIGGGGLGPGISPTGGDILGTPFAKGAAFSSGIGELVAATQGTAAAQRFARGGVLESPTLFRFARGVGLAGEAGPEAILPLARMGDGKLGVLAGAPPLSQAGPPPLLDMGGAGAGGATTVNITINAPGADREGLREVKAELREVRNDLVRVNRSIEPRAISAWANHRRRGGFR